MVPRAGGACAAPIACCVRPSVQSCQPNFSSGDAPYAEWHGLPWTTGLCTEAKQATAFCPGDFAEGLCYGAAGLPLPNKHKALLAEMLFAQMLCVPQPPLKPLAYSTLMVRPLHHTACAVLVPCCQVAHLQSTLRRQWGQSIFTAALRLTSAAPCGSDSGRPTALPGWSDSTAS